MLFVKKRFFLATIIDHRYSLMVFFGEHVPDYESFIWRIKIKSAHISNEYDILSIFFYFYLTKPFIIYNILDI